LFYFPQNAIYFKTVSFSIEIILVFFINQAQKFKYQPGHIKVKGHQFQSVDDIQEKQYSSQTAFLKHHIWNAGKNGKMFGIA